MFRGRFVGLVRQRRIPIRQNIRRDSHAPN
jgi:hypothetical protein